MSDVSVIGLGQMGSALARAFLSKGKTVTIWNRTPSKADSPGRMGAVSARNAADAVAASPILVLCLSDYAATASVLGDKKVTEMLSGRLIVQLSSGTPNQARSLNTWATQHNASYLDGAISAWPSQIGGPDATIVISGAESLFVSAKPMLDLLAGTVTYSGTDISHAKVLFNAALSYFASHWIGFSYGAAICEAEGLRVDQFGEMMASLSSAFGEDMRHMGRAIAEKNFDEPESTIRTVGADINRLVELSTDLEIGSAFPTFAAGIFQQAIDVGLAAEEHCAVIKVLRTT